jgi:hypothetical protein
VTMRVTVFLNETKDDCGRSLGYFGYQTDHVLRLAQSATVAEIMGGSTIDWDDQRVLDRVFHLFNVGDDPDFGTPSPVAVSYRTRRNRSLSVGDVVMLDGRSYACAESGWEPIEVR